MLAMSGGVDSSAAARLLLDKGYEVVGVTFDMTGGSTAIDEAKSVAETLGIKHFGLSLADEFKENVINDFADTYLSGGTPNPCIVCNERVKFKYLLDIADEHDCRYIATGHYARITRDTVSGRYCISKASYLNKDQSYVLYRLGQEALSRLVFPLSELDKPSVREIAKQGLLPSADKGDSQDICFVPDGDYAGFLERECGVKCKTGDFVALDGRVLGCHKGIIHYTVGQRKGLGLALPSPMYVTEKDAETNSVILGFNEDLFKEKITVADTRWQKIPKPKEPVRASVKIRYSQREAMATVIPMELGCDVVFDEPQRAPAKGQSAVFYSGDDILGGGMIV